MVAACGRDPVALVRHGGRTAAALARGLKCFGYVGLHHERDVARDLATGAGNDYEDRSRFSDPVAVCVPWRLLGQRQIEFQCQLFGNSQPRVAERSQSNAETAFAPAERSTFEMGTSMTTVELCVYNNLAHRGKS
jgi:hypothetical protein